MDGLPKRSMTALRIANMIGLKFQRPSGKLWVQKLRLSSSWTFWKRKYIISNDVTTPVFHSTAFSAEDTLGVAICRSEALKAMDDSSLFGLYIFVWFIPGDDGDFSNSAGPSSTRRFQQSIDDTSNSQNNSKPLLQSQKCQNQRQRVAFFSPKTTNYKATTYIEPEPAMA